MIDTLYKEYQHWAESGGVYLISDPHVLTEDGFKDDIFRPTILDYVNKINKMVHKNDTLICLGDIGDFLNYVSLLNAGTKILLTGNHDRGDSNYKRIENWVYFAKSRYTREELENQLKIDYPRWRHVVRNGDNFQMPDMYAVYLDNGLFDEVYSGPLFVGERILLSHEPINGMEFCINIHGHSHNYPYAYKDGFGGKHLNLAANVIQYQIVELKKLIKHGLLAEIPTIHQLRIDKAKKRKGMEDE